MNRKSISVIESIDIGTLHPITGRHEQINRDVSDLESLEFFIGCWKVFLVQVVSNQSSTENNEDEQ
jgi:hypothetical protein